jgi:TetR/AcrR family transcriptional regulator, regulator of autoinduction and epiphytic fitness
MSATPTPASPPVPRDGRRARRHRSRDQAVDALLDLLEEGVTRPTAQQVAERSGVSLRSIFRIFDDVETLHAEAGARQLQRSAHLYVDVSEDGPLAKRIKALVAAHDRLYLGVAPVRRAALRVAADAGGLASMLDLARQYLGSEVQRVFGPELEHRADADVTVRALELVLSFEAWDQMASGQGLDADGRQATTAHLVAALLAPAA